MPVPALAVGDQFIPAGEYTRACREVCGAAVDVREVTWAGTKAEQHEVQHAMEWHGANAVPAPAELVAAVGTAQALLVHFAPVSAAVLAAAPKLRLVAVARAGLENVDVATATARGVGVVGVGGRNATAVAELAIGLLLAESRDIARADASVRAGGWVQDFGAPRRELGGSTVGLLGFGHVGRALASRLRGFEVRLLVADPYVDPADLAAHGAEPVDIDTLFAAADFVVVCARLTAETERIVDARLLGLLRPTAYLVNTARSRLVDTAALYAALAAGRIAGAAIDVWDEEPLPVDSPWRSLPNLTATTHYGGDTAMTVRRSARLVAAKVAELLATGRVRGAVNAAEIGWA